MEVSERYKVEPEALIIIHYWWLLSDSWSSEIPIPREAAGCSSVSTHTKRQVTQSCTAMINENRRGHKVGFGEGLDQLTASDRGTNLDKGNVLLRMTPGKVIVQRNAGNAALAVCIQPLAQSTP